MQTVSIKNVDSLYRESMYKIFAILASKYCRNKTEALKFFEKYESPVKIMCEVYNIMVSEGIKPIENLTREEKTELIKECIGSLKVVEMCKSIYAIKMSI